MGSWKDLLFLDKIQRSLWLRVAIRCWVAGFLCVLSMVISPVEHGAGQAAFLPIIFIFIKPPSEPTIVFLFQMVLTSIVLAAEWAWCILGMKLSLLSRNSAHDLRIANATIQNIYTHSPNATRAEIEGTLIKQVFEGEFLQAGSSAVWAAFLFVGMYFALLIRVYNVRLFFVMVFSVILVAIFSTYAPLLPLWFALPLSQIYFVPFCYYLASALFAVTFVFPTSTVETCSELLRTQSYALHALFSSFSPTRLATTRNEILASTITMEQALNKHLERRNTILGSFDFINPLLPFLGREISISNASSTDIRDLVHDIRSLVRSVSGFSAFARYIEARGKGVVPKSNGEDEVKSDDLVEAHSSEDMTTLVTSIIVALESSSTTTTRFSALTKGMQALCSFYDRQTSWRTTTGVIALFSNRAALHGEELTSIISEIEAALRLSLDQVPEAGPQTSEEASNNLHPIQTYLHTLYTESLAVSLAHLAEALRSARRIESQRVRIWLPWTPTPIVPAEGLEHAGEDNPAEPKTEFASHGETRQEKQLGGIPSAFGGTDDVPAGEDNPDRIQGMRLRSSRTQNGMAAHLTELGVNDLEEHHDPLRDRRRGGVLHKIVGFLHWFGGTESTFSLKIGILAVALACPAWITNNGSAKFYYQHKGVWALIMAMTSKGVFSSETTFGYIQRVIGAITGATIALVAWYISTGNGHGNAYGFCVVCGILMLYAIPHRIWYPNFLLSVTATTTAGVVLGYSWIDETIPVEYNPGVGYQVYWRRLLLVIIGLTATWIIDLLPRPKTGREDLRKTYAQTTLAIGSIAASVLTRLKQSTGPRSSALHAWRVMDGGVSVQLLSVHNKLRLSSARIALAKLEPSLNRAWLEGHYGNLQRIQFELLDLLGILAFVAEQLDPDSRAQLISSDLFQPRQVSLLLNLFYSASTALHTENSLPYHLPAPYEIISLLDKLDINLANIAGEQRTREFTILAGSYIGFCKGAEELTRQCQIMFGTSLHHS